MQLPITVFGVLPVTGFRSTLPVSVFAVLLITVLGVLPVSVFGLFYPLRFSGAVFIHVLAGACGAGAVRFRASLACAGGALLLFALEEATAPGIHGLPV